MGFRGKLLLCAAMLYAALCPDARADPQPKPLTTAEVEAFRLLKSFPREWSGTSDHDCKTYEDKNIDGLLRSFAVPAARFLKAFVEVHGAATITSAHRTAEEQTCVCIGEKGPCAGRPRVIKKKKRRVVVRSISHHQLGIALDVRAGTGSEDEFICLQEFALLNPQFGVRFPFGKRDYPHMEPAMSQPATIKVAALGSARAPVTPCNRMKIMLTDDPVD